MVFKVKCASILKIKHDTIYKVPQLPYPETSKACPHNTGVNVPQVGKVVPLDEDVGHNALQPLPRHPDIVVWTHYFPECIGPRLLKQGVHDHILRL